MGLSLATRMKERKQPLKSLLGYEVYNQSVNDARSNATALGLGKKQASFKSADLSQPTLGVKIHCDVVICGALSDHGECKIRPDRGTVKVSAE